MGVERGNDRRAFPGATIRELPTADHFQSRLDRRQNSPLSWGYSLFRRLVAFGAGDGREEDGKDSRDENSVERPGPTDGGNRGAKSLNIVQIQEIGADQGSQVSGDVGQGRRLPPRKYQRHARSRQGRNEDRHTDAHASAAAAEGA